MNKNTSLLEACIAHLNDIVIITEAEPLDDPGPRIVFVNEAFVRDTGYSREEAIGQSPRILQGPLSDRGALDRIRKALKSWSSVREDLLNYTKDGTPFWCELEIVPVANETGWYTHWIAIQRDINQRKKLELELEASQAKLSAAVNEALELAATAQAASAAKSTFLANMSHEIRTPMNAVLGMLQVLIESNLNAGQLDYANKAEAAARALLRLLNDILDVSKLDASKMVLEQQPFSLAQLSENLANLLLQVAHAKGIDLRVECDATIEPWLMGDSFRLMQVLTNLTGNAIKFTDTGQVRVSMRQTDRKSNAVCIEFAVQDSGMGIAAESLAHIFDDFTQAESSTTRRFGGTGLGLTICKRLVTIMGGTLNVVSTIGAGSTFSFACWFSVAATGEPSTPVGPKDLTAALAPGSHPMQGMRVLVVEDNAINQLVVRELLSLRGATVTVAANGKLGVDAVATSALPFDVVLMDVQMPVMDGYAATRAIRQQLELSALPIIGLTANAFASDVDACIAAGMNGHLGKPFDVNVLVDTILRTCGMDRRMPPHQAATVLARAHGQGVDFEGGMHRMGGVKKLFQSAAGEFKVVLISLTATVRTLADAGDLVAIRALLHTAKGNAATVGLIGLAAELADLEKRVLDSSDLAGFTQALPPLEAAVRLATNALTDMLANAQPEAKLAADLAEKLIQGQIDALAALLDADDMGAMDVHASLHNALNSLPPALRTRLDACMQSLDFTGASAVCREVTDHLALTQA